MNLNEYPDDYSSIGESSHYRKAKESCSDKSNITKSEIDTINKARFVLIAALTIVAIIVANGVFLFARVQEERSYTRAIESHSNQIIEAFYDRLIRKMWTSQTFATELTSFAQRTKNDNNATTRWPYISFPEFEAWSVGPRYLSQATSISLAPIVRSSDLASWEAYAASDPDNLNNEDWSSISAYADIFTAQKHRSNLKNWAPVPVSYIETGRVIEDGVYRVQHGVAVSDDGQGYDEPFLLPVSQTSANRTTNCILMFNQLSNPVRATAALAALDGSNILSDFLFEDSNGTDSVNFTSPHSSLYIPIFDNLSITHSSVATLIFDFEWQCFFEGVLKDVHQPLVVVVESSCGRRFSFRVVGEKASFLGAGDLYDGTLMSDDGRDPISSSYDSFAEIFSSPRGERTHTRNCDFRISVFPSEEYKKSYVTERPGIFLALVLGLFLLILGSFLAYDCFVNKRQKNILKVAKHTSKIVGELFPSVVQDRLFQNVEATQSNSTEQSKAIPDFSKIYPDNDYGYNMSWSNQSLPIYLGETKRRLSNVFRRPSRAGKCNDKTTNNNLVGTCTQQESSSLELDFVDHTPKRRFSNFIRASISHTVGGLTQPPAAVRTCSAQQDGVFTSLPIADLYPEATVLFADLKGFTAWSSEREASQVFQLLETLYHSMDQHAKKFGVFKVETIGDCYVCATGLPKRQEDHAIIMVQFAVSSLIRNSELLQTLETTLGPGTADLAMRCGIHSGPVTAGVLRGEKSRFQLFGDTMNTASRMESTGMADKIHLSMATASLLISNGKSSWVSAREELVAVKGKGHLQTYWLIEPTVAAESGMEPRESTKNIIDSHEDNQCDQNEFLYPSMRFAPSGGNKSTTLKDDENGACPLSTKAERLVDWNTECLLSFLHKVVVARSRDGENDSDTFRDSNYDTTDNENSSFYVKYGSRKDINNSKKGLRYDDSVESVNRQQPCRNTHPLGSRSTQHDRAYGKEPQDLGYGSINNSSHSLGNSNQNNICCKRNNSTTRDFDKMDDTGDKNSCGVETTTVLSTSDEFLGYNTNKNKSQTTSEIPVEAKSELHTYVEEIAREYCSNNNSFHNFEHASHVVLSSTKLMNRVFYSTDQINRRDTGGGFREQTFEIRFDPMTNFAVVFSALIHSVSHTGAVPNNEQLSIKDSFDFSLRLLMSPRFKNLRGCIYRTAAEKKRFIRLVIALVAATDVFNEELKVSQNKRWEKLFCTDGTASQDDLSDLSDDNKASTVEYENDYTPEEAANQKKLLIAEYIIQASYLAHTMQHWNIYEKWNKCLFDEIYYSYLYQNSDRDPSVDWYEKELLCFDDYVFPLASKLKELGKFGGRHMDEYLNLGHLNRNEWKLRGQKLCREMINEFEGEIGGRCNNK